MAAPLIAVGIAGAFLTSYQRLALRPNPIHTTPMLIALVLYVVYCLLNAFGWTRVLRLLHAPIPAATGIMLWLKCEACRWIPGSVWNFGARSVAVTRHGVPASTGAMSLIIELQMTIVSWTVIAGTASLAHGTAFRDGWKRLPKGLDDTVAVVGIVVLFLSVGVALWWTHRTGSVSRVVSAVRRQPTRAIRCLLFYTMANAFCGLALYCVVMAWCPRTHIPVLAVVGANAIAWLVGFFVVFAPGGIVVREATLSLLLASWLPLDQAVSIAVAWRILQLASEIILLTAISLKLPLAAGLRFSQTHQPD